MLTERISAIVIKASLEESIIPPYESANGSAVTNKEHRPAACAAVQRSVERTTSQGRSIAPACSKICLTSVNELFSAPKGRWTTENVCPERG